MLTIRRFFGIVIAMYFDDHGPPHFHARHADGAAKIGIDTLEPIESTLGRQQLRFVLAWAELHREAPRELAAFVEARTPAGFAKVKVDPESGTVVWPGGADLAPDTLDVRARTGAWPDENIAV